MQRRKNICPKCGIDRRFRLLFQDKLDVLNAQLAKARESSQKWRRMYDSKCKVADSLANRLSKLEEKS
jgi:hypothetical protein